jgi:hypothetical protein
MLQTKENKLSIPPVGMSPEEGRQSGTANHYPSLGLLDCHLQSSQILENKAINVSDTVEIGPNWCVINKETKHKQ